MRSLLLSLLILISATAAELKPIGSLPWCRVTLNQAATIDQDAPDLKSYDGWYDEDTCLLLTPKNLDGSNPFAPGPFDRARVVSVVKAKQSPQLPPKGIDFANARRSDPEVLKAAKKP